MTRLNEKHLEDIVGNFADYEHRLQKLTGFSLLGLACKASNSSIHEVSSRISHTQVAAIPLSQGQGIISGFAQSLVSIAKHLGFISHCVSTDEKGFDDYHNQAYDCAIYANDTHFFVENKTNADKFDNNIATGYGFAEALHAMLCKHAPTSPDETSIVIRGLGPVGSYAAAHLAQKGYKLLLFDTNQTHAERALHMLRNAGRNASICTQEELEQKQPFIALLDAAPVAAQQDFFGTLRFDYISAPCVPCYWSNPAMLWHDPLQLGTAVMLIAALTNNSTFQHLS